MCNDNNHADWLKTHLVEFLIQRHREGTFKVDGFTPLAGENAHQGRFPAVSHIPSAGQEAGTMLTRQSC